jgi:hypothetical protein
VVVHDAKMNENITLTHVIYGLYGASLVMGFTAIVAIVLNYIKREDVAGTFLESHFRWQIRTFWFGLCGIVVGVITSSHRRYLHPHRRGSSGSSTASPKAGLRLNEGKPMYDRPHAARAPRHDQTTAERARALPRHVYFDAKTVEQARTLCEQAAAKFGVVMGACTRSSSAAPALELPARVRFEAVRRAHPAGSTRTARARHPRARQHRSQSRGPYDLRVLARRAFRAQPLALQTKTTEHGTLEASGAHHRRRRHERHRRATALKLASQGADS